MTHGVAKSLHLRQSAYTSLDMRQTTQSLKRSAFTQGLHWYPIFRLNEYARPVCWSRFMLPNWLE